MRVTDVTLRAFRNYERAELRLEAGLTIVCGPNGAGKTNLLEAIYLGLAGRSCRTANEREVVRHGESLARVTVATAGEGARHELEVAVERGEPKRLRVDGSAPMPGSAMDVRPPVGVFLSERLELVRGAPAHRRGHLDQLVAALWPARGPTRAAYGRALAQRNALLARGGGAPGDHLESWDRELARHGAALMADRRAAVELVGPHFRQRAEELGLPDEAELAYRPRSRAADPDGLVAELAERRQDDLARGFTTHGPHRDDLRLSHGGRPLRAYGSQGQQRAGLLALLFGERDALIARGRTPLMLLDDVMSELDAARRERLTALLRAGGQTIVTTTNADQVPAAREADVAIVTVADGALRSRPRAVAA